MKYWNTSQEEATLFHVNYVPKQLLCFVKIGKLLFKCLCSLVCVLCVLNFSFPPFTDLSLYKNMQADWNLKTRDGHLKQCKMEISLQRERCSRCRRWRVVYLHAMILFTETSPGRGCSDVTDSAVRDRASASKTSTGRKSQSVGEHPHFQLRYFAACCHQTHASITHGTDVDLMNRLLTGCGEENKLGEFE